YLQPMPPRLRSIVMVTFGALWLSGCYWLILHFLFSKPAEFGALEHPWAPTTLKIHGWIAVGSVFLLGWVTAGHVSDRWNQSAKRASGLAMASVAAVLAITGYALYYTTDRVHDFAGLVHEALGAGAVLLALTHWKRRRVVRRSELAASP